MGLGGEVSDLDCLADVPFNVQQQGYPVAAFGRTMLGEPMELSVTSRRLPIIPTQQRLRAYDQPFSVDVDQP